MPAVFQVVSRASGKALMVTEALPGPYGPEDFQLVVQFTNLDPVIPDQMWTLRPQDSADDVLIQSFSSPNLAMGLGASSQPGSPSVVVAKAAEGAQVWRITRIANPPYFFLLEADDDLVMDVPGGSHDDNQYIQVFPHNEHTNQQWTFLPVFAQLSSDG